MAEVAEIAIAPPRAESERRPHRQVAEIQGVRMADTPEQALLAYTSATPSQMALTQSQLAPILNARLDAEARDQAANPPVLEVRTGGEPNPIPISPAPLPGEAAFRPTEDRDTTSEPSIEIEPYQDLAPPLENRENVRLLEAHDDTHFRDWFRQNFSEVMARIQTHDPGIDTHAGPRQAVPLAGASDPGRAQRVRVESARALASRRDLTTEVLRNHPGQANIQPRATRTERVARPTGEVAVEIPRSVDPTMADYAAMPLPEEVRARSDEMLRPNLESHLAEPRHQAQEAAQVRDRQRELEIAEANSRAAEMGQEANQRQRMIVVENRRRVAARQQEGIRAADATLEEFDRQALDRQGNLHREVEERVVRAESEADQALRQGEQQAEERRREGERRAEAKKHELEREQSSESWWERAVSAIKNAVKRITEAIDHIFTEVRQAVKRIIDQARAAAVAVIDRARHWVVERLDRFRDWAQQQVNRYLSGTFPELARRINAAIDDIVDGAIAQVNVVADGLIAGVEALASGLAAALDRVLTAFQTAFTAAVRLVGAMLAGDFAGALRIAVQAACDIVGIDSQPIFDFIDRAASAVSRILRAPVDFFHNLVAGVGGGIRRFADNIQTHLIDGLIGWLTGALSEVPITLPERFDFKGILFLVLQILGVTWENIRSRIIRRYPPAERVFDLIEQGMEIIRRIVEEGPIALWHMVRERLSNLKEMVLSSIRDYVITTVTRQGIAWLLSLLNPVGAIIRVVKLLYDFVMFLVERINQIREFVMSVFESVRAIASGNLERVMSAVENSLARLLPVVISLLARLAGLGGIGRTVQRIIRRVSRPVNRVIDRIIDRVIDFARPLLGRRRAGEGREESRPETQRDQALGTLALADLDRPPVPVQRSAEQKQIHYRRVIQLLELIAARARTTDDIERYFPKLKRRYRLARIEYGRAGGGRMGVQVRLNPEGYFYDFNRNMLVKGDDAEEVVQTNKPIYESDTLVLTYMGRTKSATVGTGMTVDYLDHRHPRGRQTTGREQRSLFQLLPTDTRRAGNARFVRGHLLNANLGGSNKKENLFPITHQANMDHSNKIERDAIDLVNRQGLLVYYQVEVKHISKGADANSAWVEADLVCKLATYHGGPDGRLVRNDPKVVTIHSRYKKTEEAAVTGQVNRTAAVAVQGFDPSRVRWANEATYLSSLTEQELQAIPGIDANIARRIKNANIRTWRQLEQIVDNPRTMEALRGRVSRLFRRDVAQS